MFIPPFYPPLQRKQKVEGKKISKINNPAYKILVISSETVHENW